MRNFLLAILLLGTVSSAIAEDGGKVDGAIWRYSMTPVAGRGAPRRGAFRISGVKIFQRQDDDEAEVGMILGKVRQKPSPGDKVRVNFTNLCARDGSKLDLKGPITFESAGEVTGRLVDGGGKHWNFKASRVQE